MDIRERLHTSVDGLPTACLEAALSQIEIIEKSFAAPPPEAEVCTNWSEMVAAFDRFPTQPEEWSMNEDGEPIPSHDIWAFRGQSSSEWGLTSCIERLPAVVDPYRAEDIMQREFKAKAHLYSSGKPCDQGSDIEWLSLMQHRGLPTRLLDFTFAPYVAAYFALKEGSPNSRFAAIWAVELNQLASAADAVYQQLPGVKASSGLLRIPRIRYSELALHPNLEQAGVLRRKGFVVRVLPNVENIRLSCQQGLFLLSAGNFRESLESMMCGKARSQWLRLIYIDRQSRHDILRRLLQMNIHELSLFPDLDGLARFAAAKAELLALRTDA
jgi:hypothetical protein